MKDKNTPVKMDLTHWDEPHGWFSNAWVLNDEEPHQPSLPLRSVGVKAKSRLGPSGDDQTERG